MTMPPTNPKAGSGEVYEILAKFITRETHKGSVNRARLQASEALLAYRDAYAAAKMEEARIAENDSLRLMLGETINLGRDYCWNHEKYVAQCYGCREAKWTKVIAKKYLVSVNERLAQLSAEGRE